MVSVGFGFRRSPCGHHCELSTFCLVDVICKFPLPRTSRQLHWFYGLVSFYHGFMSNAASSLTTSFSLW